MAKKKEQSGLYSVLRDRSRFDSTVIGTLLSQLDEERVRALASALSAYLAKHLKKSVSSRSGLADYRTSPYVMLATASVMGLEDHDKLARFLIDTKLYTGLETSFGKQVESQVVGVYPIGQSVPHLWEDPKEKLAEAARLQGLSREDRAAERRNSVWREIDKSCILGDRRYLITIKSGPNCINDSQVDAMQAAIRANHAAWLAATKENYPGVKGVDLVIGLTYGTRATTNNKENQILVKLNNEGFEEEGREEAPGVLIDSATRSVRVYRAVGIDFWATIGNPAQPATAQHTFLEVLVALAMAMSAGPARATTLDVVQQKVIDLSKAIAEIGRSFPKALFPEWAQKQLQDAEIIWLQSAITAFFDEGI